MYFQLPDYYSGPPRYRYVPVEITPQNFHKNKRDDSMLIVDNPALIAAVREEHLNYGKVNVYRILKTLLLKISRWTISKNCLIA